jgi:hypothetical protein
VALHDLTSRRCGAHAIITSGRRMIGTPAVTNRVVEQCNAPNAAFRSALLNHLCTAAETSCSPYRFVWQAIEDRSYEDNVNICRFSNLYFWNGFGPRGYLGAKCPDSCVECPRRTSHRAFGNACA